MLTGQLAAGRPEENALRLGRRSFVRAAAGAVAATAAGVGPPIITTTVFAQATPTPTEPDLSSGVWELVAYSESESEPVEIDDPARYTLEFLPEGDLVARIDCNRGRGDYTAMDGALTVTQLATTRMACPPGSRDTVFLRLLLAATGYEFDLDDALRLRGDQGVLYLRLAADAT